MRKDGAGIRQGLTYLTSYAAGLITQPMDANSTHSTKGISTDWRFSGTSPDDTASMDPPQNGKIKNENGRGGSLEEPSLGPIISDHQP